MAAGTLKIFRDANNYTQDYVASILGISQPAYSKVESGSIKISEEAAEKLADLYNVDKETFLTEQQAVVNYNIGLHSKGIVNSENYYETGKELLQALTDKADTLLAQIGEQQKQLQQERNQLYELLNKLAEKL
jgi:transcriptional regulator with XRE-family HTH domain